MQSHRLFLISTFLAVGAHAQWLNHPSPGTPRTKDGKANLAANAPRAANGKPDLWIGGEGGLQRPIHIAIAAPNRAAVDAFYRAAIAAGGKDHGAPGLRPHYHPNYYAAFVLDPDGHNIEAVCHAPA